MGELIRNAKEVEVAKCDEVPERKQSHDVFLNAGEVVLVRDENLFALEVLERVDAADDRLYGYIIPFSKYTIGDTGAVTESAVGLKLISCSGDVICEFGHHKVSPQFFVNLTQDSSKNCILELINVITADVKKELTDGYIEKEDVRRLIIRHLTEKPLYNEEDCSIYICLAPKPSYQPLESMVAYSLKLVLNRMITGFVKDNIQSELFRASFVAMVNSIDPFTVYGQTRITENISSGITVYRSVADLSSNQYSKLFADIIMFDGIVLSHPLDQYMCKYSIAIISFVNSGTELFMVITPNFLQNEIVYRIKSLGWEPIRCSLSGSLFALRNQRSEFSDKICKYILSDINNHVSNMVLSLDGDLPIPKCIELENFLKYAWNNITAASSDYLIYLKNEPMPNGEPATSVNPYIKDRPITIVTRGIKDFNYPLLEDVEYNQEEDEKGDEAATMLYGILGKCDVKNGQVIFVKTLAGYIVEISNKPIFNIKAYPIKGSESNLRALKMDIGESEILDVILAYPGVSLDSIPVTVVTIRDNEKMKGLKEIAAVVTRTRMSDIVPDNFADKYNRQSLGMFSWNDMFFVNIYDEWRLVTKDVFDNYSGVKEQIESKYRTMLLPGNIPNPTLVEMLNISAGVAKITDIHVTLENGKPKKLYVACSHEPVLGGVIDISTGCDLNAVRQLLTAASTISTHTAEFKKYLGAEEKLDD